MCLCVCVRERGGKSRFIFLSWRVTRLITHGLPSPSLKDVTYSSSGVGRGLLGNHVQQGCRRLLQETFFRMMFSFYLVLKITPNGIGNSLV